MKLPPRLTTKNLNFFMKNAVDAIIRFGDLFDE